MVRKVCNNKVEFTACGKTLLFRLSDKELKMLRRSSIWYNGEDWESCEYGFMYNFSAYTFFDYDVKGSKVGRFHAAFPYQYFEKIMWTLVN